MWFGRRVQRAAYGVFHALRGFLCAVFFGIGAFRFLHGRTISPCAPSRQSAHSDSSILQIHVNLTSSPVEWMPSAVRHVRVNEGPRYVGRPTKYNTRSR